MTVVVQQCWEKCFRQLANDSARHALRDIYSTGNTIKLMKDVNSADGITFLLDSTIGNVCEEPSSSSSSSESWESVLHGENATALWQLELQLMAIFAAMAGAPKVFPVQFNENAAWTCNSYGCLSACQTIDLVKKNFLSPVQVNKTSCNDGLLEAACRVGYHGVLNFTCTAGPTNNMTVAILNSNAHSHVHKHGMYEEYSPCKNFFVHRYALGIHNAQEDDLKRFESDRGYHNYLKDDLLTRTLVDNLFSCIDTTCCTGSGFTPVVAATRCTIGFGDTGEAMSDITANLPPNQP